MGFSVHFNFVRVSRLMNILIRVKSVYVYVHIYFLIFFRVKCRVVERWNKRESFIKHIVHLSPCPLCVWVCLHIKKNSKINCCTVSQQKAKCFSLHAYSICNMIILHVCARACVHVIDWYIQTKMRVSNVLFTYIHINALIFRLTSFKLSRFVYRLHARLAVTMMDIWMYKILYHSYTPKSSRYIVRCNYQTN